ncbi:MAG: hypothetical protein IKG56_04780 [Clostridia bacterium]|nr:hypothetical protein [Clostridia bacterium]
MNNELGKRIEDITSEIEKQDLSKVSNEELMGYLFLVEKMKKKLEKMVNMEK